MKLGPDDFRGVWTLERTLDDRRGVMNGKLTGQAVLSGDGTALIYDEAGTLRIDAGGAMQATRRYLWQFEEDQVTVQFADGGAFHGFHAEGHSIGTPHLCGADLYQCTYDFTCWPDWQAVWTVNGPAKDYTSTSLYTR